MYPGDHARQHPDQPALVMGTSGEQLTFAEFEANANRLAHLYRAAGLRRGDHVALFMENHLRYFETMSAAERSGLYYTCINSYLTPDEVAYIVDNCDAKVFITTVAKAEVAVEAAKQTAQGRACTSASTPSARSDPSSPTTPRSPAHPAERIPDEQLGAAMLYSSGTTGRPKGILRALPDAHPAEALPVMSFIVDHLFHMREGMVYLSPAPIYHSAPQASVAGALRLGSTSIIMERFDPEQFLALVERYRRHPHPGRADDVQPAAEAARRRARRVRPVLAGGDHPRRRAVPGAREAGDDRLVRADHHRVLRRHRGQRVHVLRQRAVARPSRHRRGADPREAADPRRRRRRGADGLDRHGVVRGRDELHLLPRRREDGREPRRERAALDRRRRRATSTRTGSSSSPTARRT